MKHRLNILLVLLSILVCYLIYGFNSSFWLLTICLLSLFLILLTFGVVLLRFEYFYPATCRNQGKEVVLTFDDGPDPECTPQILDVLRKYQIKALFFVIGNQAIQYPELIQQLLAEGHQIGNHTQHHPLLFAMYSRKKVGVELDEANQTLKELMGRENKLFRPPVGNMNPSIASELKKRSLQVVGWNVRSFDSVKDKQSLLKRLLRLTKPGSVVLLHDTLPQTVAVLDDFIQQAQLNGIIFANEEALKNFVYEVGK